MTYIAKRWLFSAGILFGTLFLGDITPASAANYDVCASGCSFTTISAAFASTTLPMSSTLIVKSSYVSSTESFPLPFPDGKRLTVDCATSTAIIGLATGEAQTISLSTLSTLKNCTLNNVFISNFSGAYDITFENNIAITSPTSSGISFENGPIYNSTIASNTNFAFIRLDDAHYTRVSNNIIYHNVTTTPAINVNSSNSFNLTIATNTIRNYASYEAGASNGNLINLKGRYTLFTSNTIEFPVDPMNGIVAIVSAEGARDSFISNNYITFPASTTVGLAALMLVGNSTSTNVSVNNNTFFLPGSWNSGPDCSLLYLTDNSATSTILNVTSTFNIFYAQNQTTGCKAIVAAKDSAESQMSFSDSYNGFNHFSTNLLNQTANTNFSVAATSRFMNPYFRMYNAETGDDLFLAPFSPYLDVWGTGDIGAYRAVRDNTINFDSSQSVNYSSVDATSTIATLDALRSGDTMSLAAGSYEAFSVSSTYVTSSLSIVGASVGTSTISTAVAGAPGIGLTNMSNSTIQRVTVNGASFSDGVSLSNVSNSSIMDVTVQNASSTESAYTATRMLYTYGGNDYDDSSGVGGPASSTMVALSGSGCNFAFISSDDTDITSSVGTATNDFHVALMRLPSDNTRLTAIVPNNYYSSPGAIESDCSGFGVVVDRWVTSTFSVSSGIFSYNSSTVSNAGLTLDSGLTNPPRIDQVITGSAGIKMVDGSSNVVSSTIIQNNYYGVWFGSNASSTIVRESTLSANGYDIKSTASQDNYMHNSSFVAASSTITGSGDVWALFRARALVQTSTTTISGAAVKFWNNQGSLIYNLTTGGSGYTYGYTTLMNAFVLSSDSNSETSGGYNPFQVSASAPGFQTATTTQNLNTRNQTFTVTLSY